MPMNNKNLPMNKKKVIMNNKEKATSRSDKKFSRKFEEEVLKTIMDYNLLKKGEKIIVAISGGKDSAVVLHLLVKFGYNPQAMILDLEIGSHSKKNLDNVRELCKKLDVKLHVISHKKEVGRSVCYMRSVLAEKENMRSCSVCGIMKRYLLNKHARLLGADKIVFGHNLDDEAQTILLNLMISGAPELCANMGPECAKSKNPKFVPRVKPLYFSYEDDIRTYSKLMGFPVNYERCPCAIGSNRFSIRDNLDEWEKKFPGMKMRLIKEFLSILPEIRKGMTGSSPLMECETCGEPARNKICAACTMLEKIKE